MKKRSPVSIEEKRKRIEKWGFTISRVVNEANPEGLYVARKGNVAYYTGRSINALHKEIFGY